MARRTLSYGEKLLDPRWQKKRLEILNRDAFTCQGCGSTTRTLHVHHRWYASDCEPWEYPLTAYQTLCADCHKPGADRGWMNGALMNAMGSGGASIDDIDDVLTSFQIMFREGDPQFSQEQWDALTASLMHLLLAVGRGASAAAIAAALDPLERKLDA